MKKILLIFTIGIFLVLPLALVSATDIAYIVRDANHVDNSLINIVNESYSYDVITENNIINTNLSQYAMILIGDGIFSNPNAIPVNKYNSIILNSRYYSQWGWSGSTGQTTASFLQLRNNKINVTVTEGLSDVFFAYKDRAITAYFLNGRKPVLTRISYGENVDSGNIYVAYVNKGTNMLNGNITSGRSLFFGLTETASWTDDAKQLFKNSINWTIKGQDRDGDGYFDSDCNDNDANLWQLFPGYQDSDGDEFGRLNLLQVCSGNNLPSGYTNVTGDCDDTRNNINPSATEIPYDGLDNDCSNGDLVDGDGDGFNATIVGGNDCNDNDASFNIASIDPLKNCINDAPVLVSNIPQQSWAEDSFKEINLSDYFKDPENSNIAYSIDSSQNENVSVNIIGDIVKFIGNLNWFGDGWIIFKASDGENETLSNKVNLKVNPVNDAPILQNINDIYIIAGQIASVVPLATDIDGDNLTYEFSLPLNESGQWKTDIGDEDDYPVNVIVRDNNGGSNLKHFTIFVMPRFKINEVFFGNNGWVELYNPGNKNVNLANCSINNNGNDYSLNGNLNQGNFKVFDISGLTGGNIQIKCNGETVDEISFGDSEAPIPGENQSIGRILDSVNEFALFDIPTKGLPNNADMIAPIVNLEDQNEVINIRNVELEFNVSDNSENLTCELYNGNGSFQIISSKIINLINGFAHGNFSLSGLDDGNYNWNVQCNDSRNSAFALNNGNFEISAPDAPILNLIGGKTISENQTLEFTVTGSDKDNDTLTYTTENLPRGATFIDNKFMWVPDYNQSGQYDIKFIVKDSSNLDDSEIVRITVNNVKLPPKFTSIQCINSNEIGIEIKNPDENNKLIIGELIDIKTRIKNFGDEKKFNVNAYLYDGRNEEVVENSDTRVKIGKSENQDVEMQLKVPENINETGEYVIYVSAESGDLCNSKFIYVKVERVDNKIAIKRFDINPLSVGNGGSVSFRVKLQNIGNDDQDNLYIEIKNAELKLNIKSNNIDLEGYGGDDSISKEFTFTIPENVTSKDYDITASVIYNGERTDIIKKITVTDNRVDNNLQNNTTTYQIDIPADQQNTITYSLNALENNQETNNNAASQNTVTYNEDQPPLKIYTEDKNSVVIHGESENVKVPEYLKDSKINLLIYLLNGILIIGILVFFVRLIFYFRK